MRTLTWAIVVFSLGICASAGAQQYVYPVPWPKAEGGTIVAVPVADANVQVYHWAPSPHASGYDQPFPLTNPTSYSPAPAGVPIILGAPPFSVPYDTDEDDFYLLQSDQQLIISAADDERLQFGTPDRIFFFPSTTGTFRGRTFYGQCNADDPEDRIRVTNLGANTSTVQIAAWDGSSWVIQGTISVPPGTDGTWDPVAPDAGTSAAFRVISSEDALVVEGYLVDNATAPAVDMNTGLTVGDTLYGYGGAYFLRAVDPVSYTVETRDPGSTTWTTFATGTLAADQGIGSAVTNSESYIRITLTGGDAWAIMGTYSLLNQTEWNGYFLPTQADQACVVGQTFFTNSSARTVSMLPNAGTTVSIYDEDGGALVNSYTSQGDWEFHNFFYPNRVKVQFTNGPGAVLLVGTLDWGDCDEASKPGSCGILEGAYSVPPVTSFKCDEITAGCHSTIQSCGIAQGTTTGTTGFSGGTTGWGESTTDASSSSSGSSSTSASSTGTSATSGGSASSSSTGTSATTGEGATTSSGASAGGTTGLSTTGLTTTGAHASSGSTGAHTNGPGSASTGCGCRSGGSGGLDALLLGVLGLMLPRRRVTVRR